ncbi:SGNH/GDSL hydrolase family protein [Mesorhizobium sp.]|uniref:SGNH/GDSL hydrolase family protein n=2 Tax=Mesorhizobium sp. TaxID=1871066 RepID=UPI0025C70AA5|nr:SGNH/GDSL hydrolase family protein [Mesorhizobium sp.]
MKRIGHMCECIYRGARIGVTLTTIVTAGVALASPSRAADSMTWIGSWAASPQPVWDGDFPLPTMLPFNLWNQTVRQVVRLSLGGNRLRVVISNEYGTEPLVINAVHIALAGGGSTILDGSDRVLTFSGSQTAIVPPGAPMISDPIDLDVPARGDVSVSLFVASPTPLSTFHWDAEQTGYIGAGNQVSAAAIDGPSEITTRIFLTDVLVEAPQGARTVVALGDSITDGAASGLNQNVRWPDFLAERLAGDNVAVLNAGISGARLLQSRMGENALARFGRDVLSQPNVKTVVVLIGINDIAWPGQSFAPRDPFPTLDDIVTGFRQLIAQAHTRNVRIVVGTLTPFENALAGSPLEGYYNRQRDELRQKVNAWIRTSGEFDAVVDLDAIIRDPANPLHMKAEYDSGDHLHAGAGGTKAIADAMTLDVLFGNQ